MIEPMRYAAVFGALGVLLARGAVQSAQAGDALAAWIFVGVQAYLALCLLTLALAYLLNHWAISVEPLFHPAGWKRVVDVLLLPYRLLAKGTCSLLRRFDAMEMMHAVAPRLYVGRVPLGPDRHALRQAGVSAVLNLCVEFPPAVRRETGPPLETIYLPILDGAAPSPALFERATEWIARRHAEGHTVLVHCAQGRGRSVTVAAAALCRLGLADSPEDALERIASARPKASPSRKQRAALGRFVGAS